MEIQNVSEDKKLIFLEKAISLKREGKNEEALGVLTKGVREMPKWSDIYLARAHIYLYLKEYQSALRDFKSFGKLANKKTAGYLGEGDALKKLRRYEEAVEWYSKIINDKQLKDSFSPLYKPALERRALTYFILKKYNSAKNDFETIINKE